MSFQRNQSNVSVTPRLARGAQQQRDIFGVVLPCGEDRLLGLELAAGGVEAAQGLFEIFGVVRGRYEAAYAGQNVLSLFHQQAVEAAHRRLVAGENIGLVAWRLLHEQDLP